MLYFNYLYTVQSKLNALEILISEGMIAVLTPGWDCFAWKQHYCMCLWIITPCFFLFTFNMVAIATLYTHSRYDPTNCSFNLKVGSLTVLLWTKPDYTLYSQEGCDDVMWPASSWSQPSGMIYDRAWERVRSRTGRGAAKKWKENICLLTFCLWKGKPDRRGTIY